MLRRQVPARSVSRSDRPVAAASAPAISAPTRNRTAAISDQGKCRLPRRAHTFIQAKQAWATIIQPRPRAVARAMESLDRQALPTGNRGPEEVAAWSGRVESGR